MALVHDLHGNHTSLFCIIYVFVSLVGGRCTKGENAHEASLGQGELVLHRRSVLVVGGGA